MDAIVSIFQKLGVDAYILHQFILIVVLYNILKPLFLTKLREMIENREDKTTRLADRAEVKLKQAEELNSLYKEKVDVAYVNAKEIMDRKKSLVKKEIQEKIHNADRELVKLYEIEKEKIQIEVGNKRNDIFKDVTRMKDQLLTKILS